MNINWTRAILITAIAAVLLVAVAFFLGPREQEDLMPLREVLWVRDAQGKVHPPDSDLTKDTLMSFVEAGIDIDEPGYPDYVLFNAGTEVSASDGEPFLVMGWKPE